MSAARVALLTGLETLRLSLSEAALMDGLPHEIRKNQVATFLRNGTAVLAFATIEAFIRNRTAESLGNFNPAIVRFSDFTDALKKAVTIGALEGLLFRSKFEPKLNKVLWITGHLAKIVNAPTNVSSLSEFSFAQDGANVSEEDVNEIIKAFGIESPWDCMNKLVTRLGLGGILDCRGEFTNIKQRRHSAAHNTSFHVPHGDLTSAVNASLAICACFDILLSESVARLNAGFTPLGKNADQSIKFRFITPHSTRTGLFSEQTERSAVGSRHTVRVYPNLNDARNSAASKAKVKREHLIELNATGTPVLWSPW